MEATTRGIADCVQQCRDNRDHHYLGHPFWRFVRQWWQDLDLELAEWQVRSAGDHILAEIPLAVPGTSLIRRQRLKQRIPHAHGEAALRLPEHNLRNERFTAFQNTVGLGDAQGAGGTLDLNSDQCAAHRGVSGSDAVEVSGRKFNAGPIEPPELASAPPHRQRIDLCSPGLSTYRKGCL